MKPKQVYKFKITVQYYQNKTKRSILIPYEQISYIAIDKDYDQNNMPVVAMVCSIDRKLLDDMIENMNDNYITLNINKYDSSNQTDDITTNYISERFVYVLPDDISKTSHIDYNDEDVTSLEDKNLLKDVTIWLLPKDLIDKSRQIINGIFKNVTTTSLVLLMTNYVGLMLIEPITYDRNYSQLVIPPIDSVAKYIEYLNNNVSVFYDSWYRFFMDFDITYLLSSSGKITKSPFQNIYTIQINIIPIEYKNIENQETSGMTIDYNKSIAIIDVNASYIQYTKDVITNKLINRVITIDPDGNTNQLTVGINNVKNINGHLKQIVNLSTIDNNAAKNIVNNIESNNVIITLTLSGLDASQFTINKEYIINDPDHKDYNGKYLLLYNKQFFIKQDQYFVTNSILQLKKL